MKQIFTKFFMLAVLLIAGTTIFAQTYLINDGSEYEVMDWKSSSKTKTFDISNPLPCDQLTFNYSKGTLATGGVDVTATYSDGSSEKIISAGNGSSQSKDLNRKVVKSLSFTGTGTVKKYISNVKLTAATYADNPAATSLDITGVVGAADSQKSTTMNWSDTKAFSASITGDGASQFTASISNNASVANYGKATINVNYKHNIAGTHNATLTITNGTYTKTIALKGTTTKKDQSINWKADYETEIKLPVGKSVEDAATATSGNAVTYTSEDESIVAIINNGAAFKAIKEGTTTITATQAGDAEWNAVSDTKTVTVTNKKIQSIVWSDNLTRLKVGDTPITLGAIVQLLVNAETNEKVDAPERTALLTYTSANINVVSVSGNVLTIEGEGETTLTASVEGDENFEADAVTVPVKVRIPSAGCEDELLVNQPAEIEFFAWNTNAIIKDAIAIDKSAGVPNKLTFQHKGKKWGLNYKGSIKAQQSTDGGNNWSDIAGSEVTPTVDTYNELTVQLDRKATHIRFVRPEDGQGYHYVSGIVVTPAQYLETSINNITENSIVGDNLVKNIIINYANVKDEVLINHSNEDVKLSTEGLGNECGDFGSATLTVTINPQEIGTITDEIIISDAVSGMKVTIPVNITVKRNNQTVIWEQDLANIYTTDVVTLNATANTAIHYTSSDSTIAYADGNHLVINKYGQFTLTAVAVESEKYEQATATKTITISKATPVLEELPIATSITYGSTLGTSILEGGSTNVDGTWEWNADVAQVLNAGINNVSVLFTPDNTAWYDVLEATVALTVNKADQVLTWDFADQELTAGSTLTLNASATCGDVTYTLSDNDGVVTLDGTTLTAHKAGVVTIQASHAGDANHNAVASATYTITIVHATPSITAWPTLADVTYGATLEQALVLVGGEASVEGEFAITDELELATVPNAGTYTYNVTFTPEATEKYNTVSGTVALTVNKADQVLTWDFADQELIAGSTLTLSATATCGDVTYTLSDNDGVVTLDGTTLTAHKAGVVTIQASHAGDANHNAVASATYTITIVHATPSITAWPTLADVTYGATLEQALVLVGGEASVDGEFILHKPADLNVVPSAGNHDLVVTFVPTDSEAYASLADTVVLTVNQASQEISWGLGNISLAIGEEIVLDATASSNLAVSYVIEGDANIVVIEEDIYLVAKGEGTVTITAVQEGNNDYLAAEPISYVINVYDPSGETTNLDNVISPATTTTKCIIDGRLYIVRDGKYYDAAGRMVK